MIPAGTKLIYITFEVLVSCPSIEARINCLYEKHFKTVSIFDFVYFSNLIAVLQTLGKSKILLIMSHLFIQLLEN